MFDTIGEGNDSVTANGRTRHVNAYLNDFLFTKTRARSPVKALSGGERNRLLLARLFTRPANVLVLDEPTNDLDLETLELLEDELIAWSGTLLLVSHDRAFLDNVVTSTMVFEGEGSVQEYVGGYADWLRQRDASDRAGEARPTPAAERTRRRNARPENGDRPPAPKKLTYKERIEVDALPSRIEALEAEQRDVHARIASPDFYKVDRAEIEAALARADRLEQELADAYARWQELESRRNR